MFRELGRYSHQATSLRRCSKALFQDVKTKFEGIGDTFRAAGFCFATQHRLHEARTPTEDAKKRYEGIVYALGGAECTKGLVAISLSFGSGQMLLLTMKIACSPVHAKM